MKPDPQNKSLGLFPELRQSQDHGARGRGDGGAGNLPPAVKPETLAMIANALKLDTSLSPDQRDYILRVCRNPVPLAVHDERELPPAWFEEWARGLEERLERSTSSTSYLTVEETAKRWGMCTRSVRRFIKNGELAYCEFGRSKRIRLADVEAFERARMVQYRGRKVA